MAPSISTNGCLAGRSATIVRLATRAAQFALCLLALAFTSAGSRVVGGALSSSPSAIFAILMTYTGMLYALWHGVAVELLRYAQRPTALVELVIDAVLAVVLLIAAIALAASDLVSDCVGDYTVYGYVYESSLRCGNFKAGVAFAFIAVAAFAVSVALQFFAEAPQDANAAAATGFADVEGQQQYTDEAGEVVYHQTVATPVPVSEPLSPIGNKPAPGQQAV